MLKILCKIENGRKRLATASLHAIMTKFLQHGSQIRHHTGARFKEGAGNDGEDGNNHLNDLAPIHLFLLLVTHSSKD